MDGNDKYITFTSGGTHQIVPTEVITGDTSGATATVTDVVLTSGTWAGGNAVGYLGVSGESGVFSNAENVSVPGFPNSATLALNLSVEGEKNDG